MALIQTANQTLDAINSGQKCRLPAMFPWPCDSLAIPQKGYGLGNPMQTSAKNLAQPWREQIGYWVFERDAASGDLVLPGGSEIPYFTSGEGEPPPASKALPSFRQNLAGTNLFNKGGPVTRDYLFAAIAFGVSIGRPFALRTTEGGVITPERHYAPWTDQYGQRARDLLWSNSGFNVTFQDQACSFELGSIESYPPHAGQYGGDTVRAGGGFGVIGMLPVCRGPVYLGAVDESNKATIVAKASEEDMILDQDALAPTVDTLVVPMRLWAYGDFGPWCGPCAPTSDDIEAMVAKRVNAAMIAAGLTK